MSDNLVARLQAIDHMSVEDCFMQSHLFAEAAARIAALEAAIDQAALWFGEYANSHEKKGDTDKAKRNRDRCDFCRAALVKP